MENQSHVHITGPLETYAAGFEQELIRQGYRCPKNKLYLMVNAARNIISTAAGHTVSGRGGTSHANKHSDPVKRQPPKAA
ncbi:MAG: hypothetical protein ACYDED_05360 [Ferrimicrobium sp.]